MEFLVEWDGIVGYFRDLYFMAKETSLLDEIVSLQSAEVLSFNHPRFTEVSTAF